MLLPELMTDSGDTAADVDLSNRAAGIEQRVR